MLDMGVNVELKQSIGRQKNETNAQRLTAIDLREVLQLRRSELLRQLAEINLQIKFLREQLDKDYDC